MKPFVTACVVAIAVAVVAAIILNFADMTTADTFSTSATRL